MATAAVLQTAAAAPATGHVRLMAAPEDNDAGENATTDRLIVKYRNGSAIGTRGQAALTVAANRQGVRLQHHRQTATGAQVFAVNRRLGLAAMRGLAQALRDGDPNVEYAEPDLVLHALAVPNDSQYAQQWALFDNVAGIRAPAAWDRSTGKGVVVAVIDTGVRPHVDLKANLLGGYDFVTSTLQSNDGNGRDADPADPGDGVAAGFCGAGAAASKSSWHGTHVAGIVAAVGGNAKGVAGVAHGAKVLPLRALGRCGGYSSDIADAITWAAGGTVAGVPTNANPARVINLSLGGTGSCGTTTQNAINAARAKGAVVVVAAGNSNTNASTATPANCAGVVTVAAVGRNGGKASYSNTGTAVALAAPGGDSKGGILSTLNTGTHAPGADNYASYMGTSMAAPVVSGVAALMLAANPKLTPDQVATLLKSSARAFPAACSNCGKGIVDANAAVVAALATAGASPVSTPTPAPTPAPTPVPTTGSTAAEVEPNNTLAAAQPLASAVRTVTGQVSMADTDYSKLTLPAKAKLTVTLSGASTAALGLGVYTSTGQQLLMLSGSAGGTRAATITNGSATTLPLVLRVLQNGGTAGAYKLTLAY